MSWVEFEYTRSVAGASKKPPVTVTGGGAKVRGDRVVVNIRPSMLDGLKWWKKDGRCRVMIGADEHVGQIRFEPDKLGSFHLKHLNAHKPSAHPTITVNLSLPSGTAPIAFKQQEVEFDYAEGWLEITLPGSARPAAPITSQRPATPALPRNGMPTTAVKGAFRTEATSPGSVRPTTGGR